MPGQPPIPASVLCRTARGLERSLVGALAYFTFIPAVVFLFVKQFQRSKICTVPCLSERFFLGGRSSWSSSDY